MVEDYYSKMVIIAAPFMVGKFMVVKISDPYAYNGILNNFLLTVKLW